MLQISSLWLFTPDHILIVPYLTLWLCINSLKEVPNFKEEKKSFATIFPNVNKLLSSFLQARKIYTRLN